MQFFRSFYVRKTFYLVCLGTVFFNTYCADVRKEEKKLRKIEEQDMTQARVDIFQAITKPAGERKNPEDDFSFSQKRDLLQSFLAQNQDDVRIISMGKQVDQELIVFNYLMQKKKSWQDKQRKGGQPFSDQEDIQLRKFLIQQTKAFCKQKENGISDAARDKGIEALQYDIQQLTQREAQLIKTAQHVATVAHDLQRNTHDSLKTPLSFLSTPDDMTASLRRFSGTLTINPHGFYNCDVHSKQFCPIHGFSLTGKEHTFRIVDKRFTLPIDKIKNPDIAGSFIAKAKGPQATHLKAIKRILDAVGYDNPQAKTCLEGIYKEHAWVCKNAEEH